MTRKIGAALVLALLCGSCTRDFTIEPSGVGTTIHLKFYDPGLVRPYAGTGAFEFRTNPCISRLTVRQEQRPLRQQGRVIWQISALNGCEQLREVEIGSVPTGFVATVSHLPLRIGQIYTATARAGRVEGTSKPWLVCSEAPTPVSEDDYWLVIPQRRCRA